MERTYQIKENKLVYSNHKDELELLIHTYGKTEDEIVEQAEKLIKLIKEKQ